MVEFIPLEVIAGINGSDRGVNERADVVIQTADGADINSMWREFLRVIALHNRERDPLVNLLTYNVNQIVEQVRYPVDEDFEEATEFGEPKGIRLGPAFNLGFDFRWWDLAIRYTWLFLIESTRAQVEALTGQALEADNRLVFTRVLKQVFNSTTKVATINNQPVNVFPFYNGDTTVPPKYKNTTHTSGHNHYIVSGAATVDPGDLQEMEDHLYHHGYTLNRGNRLILLVNRQEGATIRTFKVNVAGAKYDFIPSAGFGGGVIIQLGQIVARPSTDVNGLVSIGTYGPFNVVEEDYIPAGYMLAFATGGENNATNPVGLREHDQASARGLRLIKGADPDYPLTDSFYQHGLGTGVRHRGAGVVFQIKASGVYDIPAAYL